MDMVIWLVGRKCISRVRLGATFRCAMQSVGVTAVGLSVGKRGVGRSGRCRARWWSGPVVEGRGVARTCGSMMELDATRRSAAQAERAAAVGQLVGRRRVGRSGRRGARRRKGPMAEERGAARSSGVKQAAAGGSRHNSVGLGPMRRAVAAVSRDVTRVSPCESIELCGLPETGSQVGVYMHEASSGSRRQLVS